DSDNDPDFNPINEDSGYSSDESGVTEQVQRTEGEEQQMDEEEPPPKRTKHPGRKRTRRIESWKRKKSSILRNSGHEYTDRKGIPPRDKRGRKVPTNKIRI
ncbi:hypothetical protein J6590_103313, partial [Homalodisca vitripennis]